MYESFFGLREPAFSLTPDPRFLWLSETHREGLAMLVYGITRRKGFLLLSGEVGAGKTTLLRTALAQVPPDTETALILNTGGVTPGDLLKLIVTEFGLEHVVKGDSKADRLVAINRLLVERMRLRKNTVLIIDEAQNLGVDALEEVRMLSNLETDSEKLMQIVLIGQPEFLGMLDQPELRQLRQRIAIEHHVAPLRAHEVVPYLSHRLRVAGCEYKDIFEEELDPIFYAATAGCPRLLSLLADRSLLAAFARSSQHVDRMILEEKAAVSPFRAVSAGI
jgi:general secretion pathway protein A